MSNIHRRGFTIVEVMMVILIIALLAALLTNAVQSSRETARRTQCLNKMREVAQAVIKFESDNTGYPGWRHPMAGTNTSNSWLYQLLPTLGRNDLFMTGGLNASGNPVAINDLLVCPSDYEKMKQRSPQNPTSYICNAGREDREDLATGVVPADWRSNAVFMNRAPGLDSSGRPIKVDVTDQAFIQKWDGLATTLLVSENVDAGDWNTPGNTPTASCFIFWPPPVADMHRINGPRGSTIYDLARPSSYHPGGVNAVFCDGHSRFLRDTIDYWVFCALMTPRGQSAMEPGTTNPSASQITNQPPISEAALQ